ncbi:hypothetical protein ACE02P_19285 [Shewanella bicestrii]
MTFKLYGYKREKTPESEGMPLELGEVTLAANYLELRKIASFLVQAAEAIELKQEAWEHEHLSDNQPEFIGAPNFVVYNSSFKISNKA